jgi:signal peptidase I
VKNVIIDYVKTLALAIVLSAFIIIFVVQSFVVDGESMQPTLYTGERLLVNKFIYRFREPKCGEIIVFHPPGEPNNRRFIKRVIGVPGDVVDIKDGIVYVNNKPLNSQYTFEKIRSRYFNVDFPLKVPEGCVFVLGDNRNNSKDSRHLGPIPMKSITGEAFLLYWPLSKGGLVR